VPSSHTSSFAPSCRYAEPRTRITVASAARTHGGAQYVQVGAWQSRTVAQAQWQRLSARFAHELGSLKPRYVAGKAHARAVVRLQVGVASRAAGRALCGRLHAHGQPCVAVGSG
jgi:hypothetical protein